MIEAYFLFISCLHCPNSVLVKFHVAISLVMLSFLTYFLTLIIINCTIHKTALIIALVLQGLISAVRTWADVFIFRFFLY